MPNTNLRAVSLKTRVKAGSLSHNHNQAAAAQTH